MTITFYKTAADGSTRYYTVHDRQGHLFSLHSLTVLWGTEPNRGREKMYSFNSPAEKDRKIKEICRNKARSGYRVLYSFSRKTSHKEIFKKIADKIS